MDMKSGFDPLEHVALYFDTKTEQLKMSVPDSAKGRILDNLEILLFSMFLSANDDLDWCQKLIDDFEKVAGDMGLGQRIN